jgi:hypothetical protein
VTRECLSLTHLRHGRRLVTNARPYSIQRSQCVSLMVASPVLEGRLHGLRNDWMPDLSVKVDARQTALIAEIRAVLSSRSISDPGTG